MLNLKWIKLLWEIHRFRHLITLSQNKWEPKALGEVTGEHFQAKYKIMVVLGKTLCINQKWRQWEIDYWTERAHFISSTFSFIRLIMVWKYYSLLEISPYHEMKYNLTFIGEKYFSNVSKKVKMDILQSLIQQYLLCVMCRVQGFRSVLLE